MRPETAPRKRRRRTACPTTTRCGPTRSLCAKLWPTNCRRTPSRSGAKCQIRSGTVFWWAIMVMILFVTGKSDGSPKIACDLTEKNGNSKMTCIVTRKFGYSIMICLSVKISNPKMTLDRIQKWSDWPESSPIQKWPMNRPDLKWPVTWPESPIIQKWSDRTLISDHHPSFKVFGHDLT